MRFNRLRVLCSRHIGQWHWRCLDLVLALIALVNLAVQVQAADDVAKLDSAVDGLLMPATVESSSCNKRRQLIAGSTWGVITDGQDNYPENSHCEWLIRGNSSKDFINLKFQFMDTECSYDLIYVYDGDSYNDTLLGSFSGVTLPPTVVATSGNMLILFFSDIEYALKGFVAEYSVTECPLNCTDHGSCIHEGRAGGRCQCEVTWTGDRCDIPVCPDECGYSLDRGECDVTLPGTPHCVCSAGFSGASCSVALNDTVDNVWHVVTPTGSGLPALTGHGGAYVTMRDEFFVYGGYDLNRVLGGLYVYNFKASAAWTELKFQHKSPTEDAVLVPLARYGHAMSEYAHGFAVYGGVLADGSYSSELLHYNASTSAWTLRGVRSVLCPPALAHHTLTLVDHHHLYVFGGNLENGTFSSTMFRINLLEGEHAQWELVRPSGGKTSDRRLVGHSTVFHAASRSLVVYGGLLVEMARMSKLSDRLHLFNVDSRYWSRLQLGGRWNSGAHVPIERAFHSANLVGDAYMVVFGGYAHDHGHEERCYDRRLYFYHLGCHVWVDPDAFEQDGSKTAFPSSWGLYSHVAAVRNGNTLLVAGGYSGTPRADFFAYTVPFPMVAASSASSQSPCSSHKMRERCRKNPECGWCPTQGSGSSGTCLHRWDSTKCENFLEAISCPGICPHLKDCQSCLAQGNGVQEDLYPSSSLSALLRPCLWNVERRLCLSRDVTIVRSGNSSSSGLIGWWGNNYTLATDMIDCRIRDFPPGITWLKYYHPPNWSQPDEMNVVNGTSQSLRLFPQYTGRREIGGDFVARFYGFIHPVCSRDVAVHQRPRDSSSGSPPSSPKMFLDMTKARGILYLSTDDTRQNLQLVVNYSTMHNISWNHRVEAIRPGNEPLFSNLSANSKYLVDLEVKQVAFGNASFVYLIWNGCPAHHKEFTSESLEPYSNGSCPEYSTCLQCLSDALCGWCESTSSCLIRRGPGSNLSIDSGNVCLDGGRPRELVLRPDDCALCSNLVFCQDCATDPFCEWLIEESYCVRRGRFDDAVRNATLCPAPCHHHMNCVSCLEAPGHCSWCEAAQRCFPFFTYASSHPYGSCGPWVEMEHPLDSAQAVCHSCSAHLTCRECLADFGCGWCHNQRNPLLGACISGDFAGPTMDNRMGVDGRRTCDALVSNSNSSDWAYDVCPDVEECTMGLHNCHADATCTNTQDSYVCTCNQGFRGDGNESCVQTCHEECVRGRCSETPDFKCVCELGWTGPDCSFDCGCHNHSTCTAGVGFCDQCRNWTEGKSCERCRPGSHGNATTKVGCQPCECNGHGNASRGYCDLQTGVCFCQDNTEGEKCERCRDGYYGDPREAATCYRSCESRILMTNVESGGLGAQLGGIVGDTCLWILTVDSELPVGMLASSSNIINNLDSATTNNDSTTVSFIVLTIEPQLSVRCSDNYVYLYDGLPRFIASSGRAAPEKGALGAICDTGQKEPFVVEARSGIMTVFYQRDDVNQGFNATYKVRRCSNDVCDACKEGFVGPNCSVDACPNNCSSGLCLQDYGRCECPSGYAGDDCSIKTSPDDVLIADVFQPDTFLSASSAMTTTTRTIDSVAKRLPRMGHTAVADNSSSLWVFGGWSFNNGVLGDMLEFHIDSKVWSDVEVRMRPEENTSPVGRYFHAATYVNSRRVIFIYGGFAGDKVLDDFWKFNIITKQWRRLSTETFPSSPSDERVPPLAGHTFTNREDVGLILIGGCDLQRGFLERTYEFDISAERWMALNVTGAFPIGLYGHTTVYHAPSETLYVYGGVLYKTNRTMVSDELYAFNYPSRRWTVLPREQTVNPRGRPNALPVARYLHAAVTTAEHMLVVGGHGDNGGLVPSIHAYVYDCNMWMDVLEDDARVIGKDKLRPLAGLAAIASSAKSSSFYLFGGADVRMWGSLLRVDVPSDLCHLQRNKSACHSKHGCTSCSVYQPEGFNITYCYASKHKAPQSCVNSVLGTVELPRGNACDNDWFEHRSCQQYSTCTECLANWPVHRSAKQVCHWCSFCGLGRCISVEKKCDQERECSVRQPGVSNVMNCPERQCAASDCDKCHAVETDCIWTRQIFRSSDVWRTVAEKPNYTWSCFQKVRSSSTSLLSSSASTSSAKTCPPRCSQLKDCKTCLSSDGAEGGWMECRWSETLRECLAPSYQALRCAGGVCGRTRGPFQCPRPCVEFTQCSHCVSQPHCGWCALNHSSQNGWGVCMEGGLEGPAMGVCRRNNVTLVIESLPANFSLSMMNHADGVAAWSHLACPPENECLNDHHTCDRKSEECVDAPQGFQCNCRKGYLSDNINKRCKPVCHDGCVNGTCTEPDVCVCHFGYVGGNCSMPCQCNGHSDCAGPDQLDICLECRNNTMGGRCDKCKPFFVGNPQNNGQCIPCRVYCNEHTTVCIARDALASLQNVTAMTTPDATDEQLMDELSSMVTEGPPTEAVCLACRHFTEGDRCENCVLGYFRSSFVVSTTGRDRSGSSVDGHEGGGDSRPRDECRPCECNGHSDTCNRLSGEQCKCENNTVSDTQQCQSHSQMHSAGQSSAGPSGQHSNKGKGSGSGGAQVPCWRLQCSKCPEQFIGVPTHGHQCYRLMMVDREYSFDPKSQDRPYQPNPLLRGRTVFFGIHPRYLNVDMRVIVDVTQGALDFHFSPNEDTFVVEVNRTTGIHTVSLDAKYGIEYNVARVGRSNHLSRRSIDQFKKTSGFDSTEVGVNVSDRALQYKVREREAATDGLNTLVTITDPYDFVVVRNLRNRLVLTLPQSVYNLKNTRFFMVLHGTGVLNIVENGGRQGYTEIKTDAETYGSLFFRQDQPRIDLFVFFSVFFSCFFLFLAVCVVIWKAKQAVDVRRARRRHAVEMEHMASRPFARTLVIISDVVDPEYGCAQQQLVVQPPTSTYSPSHAIKKNKTQHFRDSPLRYRQQDHHPPVIAVVNSAPAADNRYGMKPVAVEPTEDAVAAVATVLLQLPGGTSAPVRLTLGSALVLVRACPHTYSSIKACMRRRVSHHSQ